MKAPIAELFEKFEKDLKERINRKNIICVIKGETNKGMSCANIDAAFILCLKHKMNIDLWQENLQEIQAKTAGLALALGHETGLRGQTLEFFVNFIAQRFPDERDECYIIQWVARFVSGTAMIYADKKSKGILLRLAEEMNLPSDPLAPMPANERVTF